MIDCAVIFAFGNPAHQSQLTYNRSRVMLPALGRPMVVRMMDRLLRHNIKRFRVILSPDEGAIAEYLNAHWVPDAQVDFHVLSASDTLNRVLADAARQLDAPFILASYNTFFHPHHPDRMINFFQEHDKELILTGAQTTLSRSEGRFRAQVENRKVLSIGPAETEYPYILSDIILCDDAFREYLQGQAHNSASVQYREIMPFVQDFITAGGKASMVESAWTLQVESDHDLLTLTHHLLDEEQDAHILSELPKNVQIIPPVRIDPQVSIGQGAVIGPHTYLESGCSIGSHAVVQNCIVTQKASVKADETVQNMVISSRFRLEALL